MKHKIKRKRKHKEAPNNKIDIISGIDAVLFDEDLLSDIEQFETGISDDINSFELLFPKEHPHSKKKAKTNNSIKSPQQEFDENEKETFDELKLSRDTIDYEAEIILFDEIAVRERKIELVNLMNDALKKKDIKKAVQIIDNKGFDVNIESDSGNTPLHLVVSYYEYPEILYKLVKEKGADINAQDARGDTALHESMRKGSSINSKALLKLGADRSLRNNLGHTAHHYMSDELKSQFYKTLKPIQKQDLLIEKSKSGNIHDVKILLGTEDNERKKKLINSTDKHGNTALHHSAMNGRFDITKLLIENGANTQATNSEGKKPQEISHPDFPHVFRSIFEKHNKNQISL